MKSATQQTQPRQHGRLPDGEDEARLKGADGGGGGTPATALGCYGPRTQQQAAPVRSSPPGAALGQLHVDATAAEAGNRRRRREPRVSVAATHGAWRLGHGWRRPRGGGAL
jgi:hypothetical protein